MLWTHLPSAVPSSRSRLSPLQVRMSHQIEIPRPVAQISTAAITPPKSPTCSTLQRDFSASLLRPAINERTSYLSVCKTTSVNCFVECVFAGRVFQLPNGTSTASEIPVNSGWVHGSLAPLSSSIQLAELGGLGAYDLTTHLPPRLSKSFRPRLCTQRCHRQGLGRCGSSHADMSLGEGFAGVEW